MAAAQKLFSRPFRVPSAAFRVTTADGLMLSGSRVGDGGPALVFCHGFLGWHRKPGLVRFVERLAGRFTVYAFDFRGHGDSEGHSTYGDLEPLDIQAVTELARAEEPGPLVTMGISMGGSAVLRHAAIQGGVDAVVAISAPGRWTGHEQRAWKHLMWVIESSRGRAIAKRFGYRLADAWSDPETPEEVIGRIAPTPVILVHGEDDRVFDVEEARRLYRAANEPKRLMIASRFGHAEDGLRPAFADLISARITEALSGAHAAVDTA